MDQKEKILKYLRAHRHVSGKELRDFLGISRQALHVHLRQLILSGKVVRTGSNRSARYDLATRAASAAKLSREIPLAGLDEIEAYEEAAILLNLSATLPRNVEAIVRYAFTEMLNNAIEHSHATSSRIHIDLAAPTVSFEIRDRGVGVFASIASKLRLDTEETAMAELLKGKTTTQPEAHTGEGIFFTSRAADRFVLRSHRIQVEWNALDGDVFVSKRRFIKGTHVRFLIRRSTRRRLEDVFGEFAPAVFDFRFEKTRLFVKLLRRSYVSRSEARRLLVNAEKFREIVLDFRQVESVGQGFADEVFRVFAARQPDIVIRAENTNEVLDAMFRHVRNG